MKSTALTAVQIEKATTSRIRQVDFENLDFGKVFTDHMFVCEFKNGSWQTPTIKPYQAISLFPSASVFHYGQAVFEGMKAYKDDNGKILMFRPEDNLDRINKSAKRMAIPEFPKEFFFDGLESLLKLDNEWIKPGIGNSLYIRPFVIATEAGVRASAAKEYMFFIICSPAQSYYGGEVRLKIEEEFSRAAPGGFGYAKAAGNYGGQFYPTQLAAEQGFQQIIWTDAKNHEYIEEAGTMNLFFRINDTLVTGPTSDTILDGITRKSLIELAKYHNIKVEERPVKVNEVVEAAKDGSLKEMFGAGTAAVINPVKGFGFRGERFELENVTNSYASLFKKELTNIQYNVTADPFGWRYVVE
ncbi:branched-chain amino acid aminotransferase [Spongiivirga sp. MCCC 1A20706]|uniref:branched-chain amino acid aminotransferase n=1 Tax=Spongiivirga sp. MCCC 1A20706 TaxID=3160963 RepID=UPI003977B580